FTNEPLSVSEVTERIKALLEEDEELADVRVAGEISNLSRPASGHVYFTLKDAGAQIRCVMWRSAVLRLRRLPVNGDAVVARGHISVYERDGQYQLYVDSLAASGLGDLYQEFERLKAKLEAEGLFDAARKRPLPAFPSVLGVVTSPTGAAFQDILNVLRRRFPLIEVVLAPTLVQGDEAPPQIARAIELLNDPALRCDVILVARGGGSLEELWAFNDERVVRAIAGSRVPVVSGVGHEVDFTLADFAADVRAPTPSAAAEIITPDIVELRQSVDALSAALDETMQNRIDAARADLETLRRALRMLSPLGQLTRWRERVAELRLRFDAALAGRLGLWRAQLDGLRGRLEAVSPQATLARGYAIVQRDRDGAVVRSVNDVAAGDALTVRVADGAFGARAT
ncbi:MAG: exodeoxyribonuclease VII large subunit, partial [Anaerolineae bacterium]